MRTCLALDLADAEKIVAAALAEAKTRGWHVTVAVVDAHGVPILLARMDEASPASVSMAKEKARSAALTGLPTKTLEAMAADRPGLLSVRDRVAVEGGLPILHQAQRVGGVGVSGLPSDKDALIAASGIAALET
jgi:glc operon protein GlcG